jgi:hypothetical protein
VRIELRADCGFAVPALYDYCEAQHIPYTIGRPASAAGGPGRRAPSRPGSSAPRAARRCACWPRGEGTYQADSWSHARRVVFKAEALDKGLKLRFIVTTRAERPETLYHWYTRRGEHPELCIKDLKEGCFADRLSCRRFWANQFRLLLHSAAYWLLATLRRWLARRQVPHLQRGTLRLRLLKIGGWVRPWLGLVHLHLASSHPGEPLWHLLATRPNRL